MARWAMAVLLGQRMLAIEGHMKTFDRLCKYEVVVWVGSVFLGEGEWDPDFASLRDWAVMVVIPSPSSQFD